MPSRARSRAPAIRLVRPTDAGRIATLATQLGYPSVAAEVLDRLPGVLDEPSGALLAAVDADDRVIGWLHVELKRSVLAPLAAQVMGLVVDEGRRSEGIGAALLQAAEAWARERGCRQMLVATRVTRERAHGFYRRAGYGLLKTSHVFEKGLA